MMEVESRKRQVSECEPGDEAKLGEKKPKVTANNDDAVEEDDDILAWLSVDEEAIMELIRLLEPSEPASSPALHQCNFKVKFSDNPYTSPVIVQSSSGFVTINGNEESCGSSFSDSESSVMASVDRCSVRSAVAECSGEFNGGACGSGAIEAHGDGLSVKEIDGCDCLGNEFDIDVGDDAMWEKFLGNDFCGSG